MAVSDEDRQPSRSARLPPVRKDVVLDEVDREIVRMLQTDGRTPNTEIARALGVTEATIRKRIARLVDDGLIEIVAVPMGAIFGMTTSAIFGLSVELKHVHALADRLVAYPEVRYVGLSTGRYDLIVEAFFSDQEHLLEFLAEKVGNLTGVRDVETSLILHVAKFGHEWEIP
jgi:Lrp/AsnC family transcriptional regulator for asnA, asnC and gidA